MRTRIAKARRFLAAAGRMVQLVWRADPLFSTGVILLTVAQGLLPLATAWVTKLLFDLLAQSLQQDTTVAWSQLVALLLAQAVLAVVQQAVTPTGRYLNTELGRKLTLKVQSAVYGKLNSFQGLAYFENPEFYDKIRLAEQGAQQASGQSLKTLLAAVQHSVTLASFVSVLIAFEPMLAGLVVLGMLPQLYAQLKMGHQRFRLSAQLSPWQRYRFFYSFILSRRQAAKEVRLFGLGSHFLDKMRRYYEEIHGAERQQDRREARWRLGLGVLSSIVVSIAFVLVVLAAFTGRLSLGDVSLYVNAVNSVQTGLSGLILAVAGLAENTLFYTYYEDLLALPPALPVAPRPVPVPALTEGIELRRVSFRYGDEHPWVLRDVTLFIPAGQCLALVGLNGAGKTTLAKLLTRLYDPTKGEILWDGIDIRRFDPAALRRRMGAIFQDFVRYDLTVQKNVGLGDVTHLDDLGHVRRAAKQAGVHDAIEKMPNGYQTQLGFIFAGQGPGLDLSGGQWQKLATARLFMREQADLLILDEPTAALDAEAEYETYRRFADLLSDRTGLLISHRFSTVRMADCIAVLEHGKIIEQGSHDELLAQDNRYAHLFRRQADRYQTD